MDAHKAIQRIVAVAAFVVGFSISDVGPVNMCGGNCNLRSLAQLDSNKSWMAEGVCCGYAKK